MPSPFPGMDPYLEGRPWRDVHHRLITAIGDTLAPQVAPRYFVAIEERTYVAEAEGPPLLSLPDAAVIAAAPAPDSARGGGTATAASPLAHRVTLPLYERMREGYLEIRDVQTMEVISAIEVLSPTDKTPGDGRREYEAKRRRVLETRTSLVEIDLLRGGAPMAMKPAPASDYRVLVAHGWRYPEATVHEFGVREEVPDVGVPLREGEDEAVVALGVLLRDVYDRARYDLRIDYRLEPPVPPLPAEDAAWVEDLLRSRGLRD